MTEYTIATFSSVDIIWAGIYMYQNVANGCTFDTGERCIQSYEH